MAKKGRIMKINRDLFELIIEEADFGEYIFDGNDGAVYDGEDSAVMTVYLSDPDLNISDVSFCDDIRVSIDGSHYVVNAEQIVNIDEVENMINERFN